MEVTALITTPVWSFNSHLQKKKKPNKTQLNEQDMWDIGGEAKTNSKATFSNGQAHVNVGQSAKTYLGSVQTLDVD